MKYGQEVIPNGSDVVIITAQSADYKEREMTSDLLFVNTILPIQIILAAYFIQQVLHKLNMKYL